MSSHRFSSLHRCSPQLTLPMQHATGWLVQSLRWQVRSHHIRSLSTSRTCRNTPTSLSTPIATLPANDSQESTERRLLKARATIIRRATGPADRAEDDFTLEKVTGQLRKVDVCRRYNLQPRDVRDLQYLLRCTCRQADVFLRALWTQLGAIDTDVVGRRMQIFVRPGTIVFSANIRAVIRNDKALLLEPKDTEDAPLEAIASTSSSQLDDGVQHSRLAYILQAGMRKIALQDRLSLAEESSERVPFEFIVLEALLGQTAKELFRTSEDLQKRYAGLMHQLNTSEEIPTSALQEMLEVKDLIEEFKSDSEEFRQAVSEVLREEPDMAAMYLTEAEHGKPRATGNDDEIELLLEMHRHHAYTLTDLATTLLTRLQSVTNHVTLLLSSTRNRLLNLEITIAFTTLGTSVGGLIGAAFGMNLSTGIEETPHMFLLVSAAGLGLALLIIRWGRRALRQARSIRGEQHSLLQQTGPSLRHRFRRTHVDQGGMSLKPPS